MKIQGNALLMDGSTDKFVRSLFLMLRRHNIQQVYLNECRDAHNLTPGTVFLDCLMTVEVEGMISHVNVQTYTPHLWHLVGHEKGQLPYAEEEEVLDALKEIMRAG